MVLSVRDGNGATVDVMHLCIHIVARLVQFSAAERAVGSDIVL